MWRERRKKDQEKEGQRTEGKGKECEVGGESDEESQPKLRGQGWVTEERGKEVWRKG